MGNEKLWKLILRHQTAACTEMAASNGDDPDEYYDKLAALVDSEGALIAAYDVLTTRIAELEAQRDDLLEKVRKANQLALVASDWNLNEVEIDGEMVPIFSLVAEFTAAISRAKRGA